MEFKIIGAVAVLIYGVLLTVRNRVPVKDVHIDGSFEESFRSVFEALRNNLADGWERGGGSLVVYVGGRKVVDIWGGWADKETRRFWKNDTLNVVLSCSKAMGAIVVAQLVDRGHLAYDDLVTKHWPEFGQNGKQNVTVRWLIGHKAGLAYTDHPISKELAEDPELIDEFLAKQKPNWPPGEEIGYHAVTFGWLVDAIVRRTDPKRRTVGTYFREEIAEKYGVDFHIGLPPCEQRRVARITTPTFLDALEEFIHDPKDHNILGYLKDRFSNGSLTKVLQSTPWLKFVETTTLNNPEIQALEQVGVLGLGTARSMAQVFELLRTGKLLSDKGLKNLLSNFEAKTDVISGVTVARGQGFMMNEIHHNGRKIKLYGHAGYGGQNIRTDFENDVTIAYLSNGLKVGFGDAARTYKRLLKAIYDVALKMVLNIVTTFFRVVFAWLFWLVAAIIAAFIFAYKNTRRRQVFVDGFVDPAFSPVLREFRRNFEKGVERDGAAFCAFYRGRCVVDVWGGYADREAERFWFKDTMQITFSSSKALAAICIAKLVDQKLIRYEDRVCDFWPEFAKNGKEAVTVEMIMTHTAGLPKIDSKLSWEDARDHVRMSKILENQTPVWTPGTKVGYHCFSYGWLVDQIVRRADPKKRSIGSFFREEIAEKHNLDIHIGLPLEHAWRVARITPSSVLERIEEYIEDPEVVDYPFWAKQMMCRGLTYNVATNPSWMQTIRKVTLNNPEMYALEQTAALAIGTARDMARLAQLVIDGSIVSEETLRLLNEPLVKWRDVVTNACVTRGRGTTVVDVVVPGKIHSKLVGHAGLGGQNFRWDRENEISLAYLSNALKSGLGDRARPYVRLLNRFYECIPGNSETDSFVLAAS
ncbi:unnamed protein product [Caenorhabditis auriculariae]|uniref:Beta-lactamase-related domain-containing protein n=1 Tax=Caenorhabditis auriculariae TaxID=2777116 RepID=A0A8S1HAK6_9PELO|nr:unnamed protein product [Caenorhabditis auriculariae]